MKYKCLITLPVTVRATSPEEARYKVYGSIRLLKKFRALFDHQQYRIDVVTEDSNERP